MNQQVGIVTSFAITYNKVSIIFVRFNDPNPGKRLITTNNICRNNNWALIKSRKVSIFIRKLNMESATKRTQFPLRLSWACKIHKMLGLSLAQAVVSFDLQNQNSLKPGQTYVALSRITSIKGLSLIVVIDKEPIKANKDANCEYVCLRSEVLFSEYSIIGLCLIKDLAADIASEPP